MSSFFSAWKRSISNFMHDTQDLSTIRGGGLLLLDVAKKVSAYLGSRGCEVEPVVQGASAGLFDVESSTPAEELRERVERKPAAELPHATFVVDVHEPADGESFPMRRAKVPARNLWRQRQAPTVIYPAVDKATEETRACVRSTWYGRRLDRMKPPKTSGDRVSPCNSGGLMGGGRRRRFIRTKCGKVASWRRSRFSSPTRTTSTIFAATARESEFTIFRTASSVTARAANPARFSFSIPARNAVRRRVLVFLGLAAGCLYSQALPLTGIAHIGFRVTDLEKSRAYYTGMLGTQEAFHMTNDAADRDRLLQSERRPVPGVIAEPAARREPPLHAFGFRDHGYRGRPAHAGSAGTEAAAGSQGARRQPGVSLRDPDNQRIEFVQYMEGSLHRNVRGKFLDDRRLSDHLQHTGVTVRRENLQAAWRFYHDQLGFQEFCGCPKFPRSRT